MNKKYFSTLAILIFLFGHTALSSQVDCDDTVVTICYLPDAIYCAGFDGCGYALDGRLMRNGLALKLTNANNFGNQGVVRCPIELLALTEDISVQYLEDSQCDIVFTGNFIVDTLNSNNISGDITSLSNNLLNNLRNWSLKESTNLVITTQAEASVWGYQIENRNENPNTSNGNALGESIFNGPFGFVPRFDQGGSYQGVITDGPSTEFETLGIDNSGSPTIVLDNATNDIIIGDIGVFCGEGAGEVTTGNNISNNNDRLIANIFALGCAIAGSESNTVVISLCPGDVHTLPDGEMVMESGVYIDTLLTINLCDSIITTIIDELNNSSSLQAHVGCIGDGYTLELNGIIYDENNTSGEETIPATNGCDSVITIDFIFYDNVVTDYTESICREDQRMIGNEIFDINNQTGVVVLQNINNCDSTINVTIDIIPSEEILQEYEICIGDTIVIPQQTYTSSQRDTFFLNNSSGCDTLLIIDVMTKPPLDNYDIPSSLEISLVEDYNLIVDIDSDYNVAWSPESLVSCIDCTDLLIYPNASNNTLYLTLTDLDGCTKSDSILINYSCPIYMPNTFSPNSDNPNDLDLGIMSPCLSIISDYDLSIYDRWGNLVHQTTDTNMRWDGFYNSIEASQGVYIYWLKYTVNDKVISDSGSITLLR